MVILQLTTILQELFRRITEKHGKKINYSLILQLVLRFICLQLVAAPVLHIYVIKI